MSEKIDEAMLKFQMKYDSHLIFLYMYCYKCNCDLFFRYDLCSIECQNN